MTDFSNTQGPDEAPIPPASPTLILTSPLPQIQTNHAEPKSLSHEQKILKKVASVLTLDIDSW